MLSHFFIDRPIFAAVLSLLITLTGGLALFRLPREEYPTITPPTVLVSCLYPGASAQVVADTVAAPIEQQVNGVENMLYMSSLSANDGSYNLVVTFDLGTDLNTALVLVQNRVALALPQLPADVQNQALTIKKKVPTIFQVVNLFSPNGRYDDLYLSNYATIHVKDELARLPGVSDVQLIGERDYSMRLWLDPEQLASRNITANDVVEAVRIKVSFIELPDEQAAIQFILGLQRERRNLTREAMSYFRGVEYNGLKQTWGGSRRDRKARDQNEPLTSTALQLADTRGVFRGHHQTRRRLRGQGRSDRGRIRRPGYSASASRRGCQTRAANGDCPAQDAGRGRKAAVDHLIEQGRLPRIEKDRPSSSREDARKIARPRILRFMARMSCLLQSCHLSIQPPPRPREP